MLTHNPNSFMSGDDPFLPTRAIDVTDHSIYGELVFESRHEGFIGIPHGGLAMGFCLDAWRRTGVGDYPVQAKYKFGGTGVKIGDECQFKMERSRNGDEPCVVVEISKNGDKKPYVKAEITPAHVTNAEIPLPTQPAEPYRSLPYYRNCFVCGHHRDLPGLKRRFRVHEPGDKNITTTPWGYVDEDKDRAEAFLIGKDELHPAVLVSIFDENTAWTGFMATRSCGLSVRMEITILRPIKKIEPLLFVGWPTGIRGNPRQPRFFLGGGTILSMIDQASPEPVAFGHGEWIIWDEYTRQIQSNLLPEHDWQWIFGDDRANL